MAAMTMTLTEYQDNGNARTSLRAGHDLSAPKMFLERRKPPAGQVGSVGEYQGTVLSGTTDGTDPIASRIRFSALGAIPVGAPEADIAAAIVAFRDFVASDEFDDCVRTLTWASP